MFRGDVRFPGAPYDNMYLSFKRSGVWTRQTSAAVDPEKDAEKMGVRNCIMSYRVQSKATSFLEKATIHLGHSGELRWLLYMLLNIFRSKMRET